MSNADIRGRFVWHELMTTDTKAAGAFYPKVTNWKTQPWEKDPSYTMWAVAKGPFGGLRPLPDAARAVGPHWLPYIGTPDVDATAHSAQALGGRVTMGATDIPDVGRFAVLADPQGALFAIYSSSASAGGGSMPEAFSWHELSTSDPEGALRFYGALVGWSEVATHDMGPIGVYHLVGLGGVASIGMWKSSGESPRPPHWLCYAQVADIDKSSNAVKAAGGKLLKGPLEVPGGTWIAQATDPQGAGFALHADRRLAAATPSQTGKASAPTSVSAAAAGKPQAGSRLSASARSQALASPSAPKPAAAGTARSAAVKKAPAKKPPAKKVAAKKATAKRGAARKSPAKKSRAKRLSPRMRPQRKAKRIAKRGMKSAAVKRRSAKQRKSSRRRTAPGRLEVARRFAAKQADSILKRLRGKKRR